jgi:hypothetical protein
MRWYSGRQLIDCDAAACTVCRTSAEMESDHNGRSADGLFQRIADCIWANRS